MSRFEVQGLLVYMEVSVLFVIIIVKIFCRLVNDYRF